MYRICFLLLLVISSLGAMEIDQELGSLNHLIDATQTSLNDQKKLRLLMMDYQKAHERYLKDPDNKDTLLVLVQVAHRLFQSIKDNHLTQTFSQDFLNDLAVFSQIAQKRGIPRP